MEEVPKTCRPPLQELLAAELRLDPRQWGAAPRRHATAKEDVAGSGEAAAAARGSEALLEVDCLVHEDWMRGTATGVLPPPATPPLPAEEMHWLRQTSCDCPAPKHWLRVSILCLRKTLEPDAESSRTAKRFLIPQEKGYSKTSIHELLTQISQENLLTSWQEVLQSIHHTPSTGPKQPTNSYVREVIHKLYHKEIQPIQSGPTPAQRRRHSTPLDKLPTTAPGLPLRHRSNDQTLSANLTTARGRDEETHSNLSPLLAALEGRHTFYLVFPYSRFTLLDVALHSPGMFNDSVSKPLFVLYQLLKTLEHCHRVGVTLGELSLRSVFVDSRLWVQLRLPGENLCSVSPERRAQGGEASSGQEGDKKGEGDGGRDAKGVRARERKKTRQWRERQILEAEDTPSASASTVTISDPECEAELSESAKDTSSESSPAKQPSILDRKIPCLSQSVPDPPAIPLSEAVKLWQHGALDNLTYLLLLNHHAGRRLGDANNHPILPWVSDFTHPSRGFRDLSKSKFRLNKGDDQLNFTYDSAREEARKGAESDSSPIPHHVGDILTDVTYYVYKARQTSREVLCTHVRPRWVPEEYPASMEKMYIWTPDECIPEFFTDPLIFRSIHPDLPDLGLPAWCESPGSFVAAHRRLLEGDLVSSQLHHWIDLTFGYKLSGEAAVRAKNVYVSLVDKHKNPKNHGIVQLFRTSHPKRAQGSSTSTALLEWESYLGGSRVADGASFPIDRQDMVERFVRRSVVMGGSGGTGGGQGKMRTLDSIVKQQTHRQRADGRGEGERERNEVDGADGVGPVEEPSHLDSSFEQIPFPDESFTSSAPSGFPSITYGDSPLDTTLPGPALSAQGRTVAVAARPKEGAVLNSSQTHPGGQNRFRVARYFRQRKQNQSEGSGDEYPWQGVEIGLPRDCRLLQGLTELEERAHFVGRCCKDFGDSLGPNWEQEDLEEVATGSSPAPLPPLLALLDRLDSDPFFTPSLEERVMVDVASVTATVVELCCIRQLRVATRAQASLRERMEVIRKTLSSGQLRIPSYLRNLVELILVPETRRDGGPSSSHLSLPHLSPSLLLQPFLPVVSFPGYFEHLHHFASCLEVLSRQAGLNWQHDSTNLRPLSSPLASPGAEFDPEVIFRILDSVSENLHPLVGSTAHGEGFVLLLLHLYPLFQSPQTSFEMVQTHLDTLGQHMSHAQMHRLFASVLVHFFDVPLAPHQQCHLLSRATADLLVRRFGLSAFLSKFLKFYLEAVLEPDGLSTRGVTGSRKNVFRLKESESVLTLLPLVSEAAGHQSSLQYDERKRQSHVSDFTFSVDLSEAGGGGYQSEGDTSSGGDSEGEVHPEASLLARSGAALESVGPAIYDINEEEGEEGEEDENGAEIQGPAGMEKARGGEGSLRMMLLPQLSLGGQDTHDGQEQRKSRSASERTARDVGLGDTDTSRERESSSTASQTQNSSTAMSLLTASLDSKSELTATLNGELPTLEDSVPTLSTDSHSDPFSSQSVPLGASGGESVRTGGAREGGGDLRRGDVGGVWEWGGWGEGEDGGEGTETREEEEEEEEVREKKTDEPRNDPETAAINQRIAEVASDTLCWLMRRLGPLLATCHIVSPLLNGMHRCFTGTAGRGTSHRAVLRCLAFMAELYGERVLVRLYLPRVESWVSLATNRMSVKAESNLAASLALVRLITRQLSDLRLEEVTTSLCEVFFIPLIQLLSSQAVFPSGSRARATVCHSLVLLLLQTGRRLGRERSLRLLLETLRLFFTCFDGVYATRSEEACTVGSRGRSESAASPATITHLASQTSALGGLTATAERERSVTSVAEGGKLMDHRKVSWSHQKKKAVSLEERAPVGVPRATKDPTSTRRAVRPLVSSLSTQGLALQQLQETFTPAMAHATYIPFCKLLGQISVNMELRNTELIEHMAYSYDNRAREENRQLPSVFLPSGDDLSSSSDSESGDWAAEDPTQPAEEDLARDVTIKLGPVVAMQQKRGLAGDAVSFGRPSWFVDLQQDVVGGELGGASSVVAGDGPGVERGNESLVATTGVSSGAGGVMGGGSVTGVVGLGESATRSVALVMGEEGGGGGRGWIEGVRGSAIATASGILGLIQSRPTAEMLHGRGSKVDDLTRHSINFDMKFQSVLGSQPALSDGRADDVDCQLTGQWGDLWEARLHQSPHNLENYSQFMGKKLQIFTGHRGSVRCLSVSNSEHFFLSASKDRTVKLWLLRNQGSGSAQIPAHLTYSQHQKPVSHVELVSTTGDILSCDGTVHLWDPEFGHAIHQYSSPRGREFIAMTTLLPPQQVAIVATSDLALRFIDFRINAIQHFWKLHISTGGILRSLACGDNWVSVGNAGGVVSTLDLRMGGLLHQWRPSDFNLVPTTAWNENLSQLRSTRHGNLVTSVGAGTMHLWRPSTGKLLSHIRGQSSSTPCLDFMGEQLVSASSNGQVVVHNCFERTKDPTSTIFWSTKVRSRELKGGVVSMATLQEKRLLLLGSENGQIVLMS